jgi:TadE-like protein
LDDGTLLTARPGRGDDGATGPTADEGMVTAELAVALPTVVVTLLAAITALLAVATQMRCTDAAATAARLVARGESVTVARSAAGQVVGSPVQMRVTTGSGSVTVVVHAPAGAPFLGGLLRLPTVSSRFTAPLEPGVAA